MDEISAQLRTEIFTLEEYIERAEDRALAARWTGELLDPLEQVGDELEPHELALVLDTLRQARSKFEVNGNVGQRIDDLLEKHAVTEPDSSPSQETSGGAVEGVVLSVDAESVETVGSESADALFDAEDEEADEDEDDLDSAGAMLEEDTEEESEPEEGSASADDLFGAEADVEVRVTVEEENSESEPADVDPALFELGGSSRDEEDDDEGSEVDGSLFEDSNRDPAPAEAAGNASKRQRQIGEAADSKIRDASLRVPDKPPAEEGHDIFSDKVRLDDLQDALGLTIPAEDLTHLENSLRARIVDKVVATLRTNKAAEKQFILMPRINRFIHNGQTHACTVINLAKTFPGLFGNLRDLGQFKGSGFLTSEVPDLGWSLMAAEAPRESLQKSYMEQNQYLRYVATSFGVPSHLVRRRTLVEAIYDVIVGRLVLGKELHKHTLDWTATGSGKNDFICLYVADEGIRVRAMGRTTWHQSLGMNPNW